MQYKYFLTGRSGTRQVTPSNDGSLEFTFEKESNRADFSRSLEGSITLKGDDFKWLYDLELRVYRFDMLTINIHKLCNGQWNEGWFEGFVSLNSGEWNIDKCTVSLSVFQNDKYECFNMEKGEVLNILQHVNQKVSVSPTSGSIVRQSFNLTFGETEFVDLFPGETEPYAKGWQLESYRYRASNAVDPNTPQHEGLGLGGYDVVWVREERYGNDSLLEQGWIHVSGNLYARQAVLYDYRTDPYDRNRPYDEGYTQRVLSTPISNGMPLRRCFEVLLSRVCPSLDLESDFFQWNPIEETEVNYVTGQISKVRNLLLFQKSGVKRPFDPGIATRAEISLEDLLNDICSIFQLEWEITDDDKFKIEHVSYKNRHQGLDTTVGSNAKLNAYKKQYKYDNDGIPKRELFNWMDSAQGDFVAAPILYTNPIAGREKDEDVHDVKNISTDVMYCLQNGDADNKKVSDDGFVLIAADINNIIIREPVIRGGNTLNNTLSWSHLHRDYWRYDRYMLNFRMNNADTVALSVKPMKIQENVKYQMCCASDFDKEGLITTTLGQNGLLRSATFNIFKEQIEMVVAFPAEGELSQNQPPVAVNDSAETFINTPVIVDVLANDTDEDGVIIPATLNITSQFRGVAQITEDFKVLFTPEQGFTGEALFRYNVRDNLGEVSNTAIATITVNPGSSVPTANGSSHVVAKNLELSKGPGAIYVNDTAGTPITVVAIAAGVSTEGGTFTISSNGSFTYVPANDFIGQDTFNYTIRDNFGNQATGVTTIDVFEPEEVFVYLEINSRYENINGDCGESGMVNLGWEIKGDITVYLYSDAERTTPLDASGYNVVVKLRFLRRDLVSGNSHQSIIVLPIASGSSRVYITDWVLERHVYSCSGSMQENYTYTYEIEPDPSYTII